MSEEKSSDPEKIKIAFAPSTLKSDNNCTSQVGTPFLEFDSQIFSTIRIPSPIPHGGQRTRIPLKAYGQHNMTDMRLLRDEVCHLLGMSSQHSALFRQLKIVPGVTKFWKSGVPLGAFYTLTLNETFSLIESCCPGRKQSPTYEALSAIIRQFCNPPSRTETTVAACAAADAMIALCMGTDE